MDKVLEILSQINDKSDKLNNIYSKSNYKCAFSIVFRGHPNKDFTLLPTLFRDSEKVGNEHLMINKYIETFPEFKSQPKINVLADMQHYGLPTRLLDWTSNPLVALYFACNDSNQKDQDGCILYQVKDYYLSPQESLAIAEFLSEVASYDNRSLCRRNAVKLSDVDKKNLNDLVYLYVSTFAIILQKYGDLKIPDSDPIKTSIQVNDNSFSLLANCLSYFYDDETKKKFKNFMQVIYSPYCFINAPSINPRIIAQQGLFQVFAGKHYNGYDRGSYKVSLGQDFIIAETEKIIIKSADKLGILSVLDEKFNINERTLYLKDKQKLVDEFKQENNLVKNEKLL